MKWLLNLVKGEPVLTAYALQLVSSAVAAFATNISPDQLAAVNAAVAGILSFLVRQRVSPV